MSRAQYSAFFLLLSTIGLASESLADDALPFSLLDLVSSLSKRYTDAQCFVKTTCVNIGEACGDTTVNGIVYRTGCDPNSAYCLNGTCVLQSAAGEACEDNEQCHNWAFSQLGRRRGVGGACTGGKCIALGLRVGEACTLNDSCLISGLCQGGKCADWNYASEGQNCSLTHTYTSCKAGYGCSGNGVCTKYPSYPYNCSNAVACEGYCTGGVCRSLAGAKGSSCQNMYDCSPLLTCNLDTSKCFSAPQPTGTACNSSATCTGDDSCYCNFDTGTRFCSPDSYAPTSIYEKASAMQIHYKALGDASAYEDDILSLVEDVMKIAGVCYSGTAQLSVVPLTLMILLLLTKELLA